MLGQMQWQDVPAVYEISYEPFKFLLGDLTQGTLEEFQIPRGKLGDEGKEEFQQALAEVINLLGGRIEELSFTDSKSNDLQLMAIGHMSCHGGYGKTWLTILVSSHARRWLMNADQSIFAEAEKAMTEMVRYVWPDMDRFDTGRICGAWLMGTGYLNLAVPGNACDIGVDGHMRERELDRGYEMTPHNLDGPMQLLPLLVGAIVIWQELRRHNEEAH